MIVEDPSFRTGAPPRILALGHSRGGTGYMSALLRAFGLDVGHERLGRDGVSCWSWATFDEDPPWAPGSRRRFDADPYLIHVVRDPLKTVVSVALTEGDPASMGYRARYVRIGAGDDWNRAAQSVIGWNRLIESQPIRTTVLIDLSGGPELVWCDLALAGYGVREDFAAPPLDVNSRVHRAVALPELAELIDADLLAELLEYRAGLGYAQVP